MSEIRKHRIEHYLNSEDGGGLINVEEIPYEVSDEQLFDESEEKEIRLIIEKLPNQGINKAWKRLLKKGLLT